MTERDWVTSTNPASMLDFIAAEATDRKLRLFGCSCCRRLFDQPRGDLIRRAVEAVESSADGVGTESEIAAASVVIHGEIEVFRGGGSREALWAAHALTNGAWGEVVRRSARATDWAHKEEQKAQCNLLRCIFGNPFCPLTLHTSSLTDSVLAIARSIYDERAFERMPVLADALEESGLTDADALSHLRGSGPHAKGCHVLDAILGKA